jgi:hypothetical protein
VVGPLLFLIIINDLGRNGDITLFTDDTTLISRAPTVEQAQISAGEHLREAESWFEQNGFQLNPSKTQSLACSLEKNAPHDEPVRLLGFMLDSKLTWKDHLAQVSSRLSRVCYLLLKLRHMVTEPYLVTVYHTMFHSHVRYGLLLWGHAPGVDAVLKIQKRAIRLITFSDRLAHCKPIFIRLGIMTVYSQYILECLIHVRENVADMIPPGATHGYQTRQRDLLDIPRVRLTKTQKSYTYATLKYFNRLHPAIKSLDRNSFKNKLSNYFKCKPYYSLAEFMEDPLTDLK